MKFLTALIFSFSPLIAIAQTPGVNLDYNWNNFRFIASGANAVEWKLGRVYYNDFHWGRYSSIKFSIRNDHYSSGSIEYLVTVHPGAPYITCTQAVGQRAGVVRMLLGPETSTGTVYAGQPTYYRDIFLQLNSYATCMVQANVCGYAFEMDKTSIGSGEFEYCTLFSSTTPTSPAPASFTHDEKRIGFGTVAPKAKYHIYKAANTSEGDITLGIDGPADSERTIGFYDDGTLAWWFGRDNNAALGLNDGIGFWRSGVGTAFTIKDNGQVTIGTGTPQSGAKLSVAGAIFAQKVKVTQTGWADFVFEKDYPLPSLHVLEQYIRTHKHLPEIPSAAEVAKEGVDLGEMNKKLLQKIEELTLHLIEQNKRLEALEKENAAMKKK